MFAGCASAHHKSPKMIPGEVLRLHPNSC